MLKPTDRTVRVGLGIALGVVVGIAATAYWVTHQLVEDQQWLAQVHTAGTKVEEVLFDLAAADNVRQAYFLHRDDHDLQLYDSARQAVASKIARLETLTRDTPTQQRNFAEFERLLNRKIALMGQDITPGAGNSPPRDVSQEKLLSEEIVRLADQMYSEEQRSLESRRAQSHERYTFAVVALTLETGFSILLLAGVFYQLGRQQQRRSKTERTLFESQERFRSLVEGVRDYAIVMLDRDGRVVSWNAGAERIYGYQPVDILGEHLSRFYTQDDIQADRPGEALRAASDAGRFEEEGLRVRTDGSHFWADVVLTALRGPEGEMRGFAKITRDVTERKKAESEIQQQRELMNAFFAATPVGLAIFDTESCCRKLNRTLCAMIGRTLQECLGRNADEILGDLGPPVQDGLQQVVASGRPVLNRDLSGHRSAEGPEFCYWVASYFPVMSQDGELAQIGVVILDITARYQAQEALRESEAMLRRLSGRLIALQDEERRRLARELHDGMGQSLAAIKINLEVLELSMGDTASNSPIPRALSESLTLTEQCLNDTRTISHLLHPPLLDRVGLSSALRWYVDGFAERSGIHVRLDVPNDSMRLPGDLETTLFRIVQESLTNIHRHSGSPTAEILLASDAEAVTLEVRDEGQGIPADRLNRCNGKRPVPGVGIAGMRERVRQFGGQLELNSNGHGTTVRAILPVGGEA